MMNYILILMTTIFIMLRLVVSVANQNVLIANAAHQNSGLYHMAKAGIDKGVYILNNVILENTESINSSVSEHIQNMNFRYTTKFISEETDHSGNFHFIYPVYKDLFQNYANLYILNFLQGINGMLNLNMESYQVTISIVYDHTRGYYIITSTSSNEGINTNVVLQAGVVFLGDVLSEIIHEKYKWYYDLPHFFSPTYIYADFYNIFNRDVHLIENNWSAENPVFFSRNENLYIDISKFYENGQVVNTVIIHEGIGEIFIYTSYEPNNKFMGTIISLGDIIFSEQQIIVEGSLISARNIYFYDLEVIANNNVLLDMDFLEKQHKRKLYDALFLTNFSQSDSPLRALTLCSTSHVEITIDGSINLRILYMTERTRF